MGEYLQRDATDPNFVPSGGGMNAEQAKAFAALAGVTAAAKVVDTRTAMAQLIADQTGKSVEEVLAFMGPAAKSAQAAAPKPVLQPLPEVKVVPLPVVEEESVVTDEEAKALAPIKPVKEVPADGFVVTEIVDVEDASQAELDQAFPEEDENDWSGKIREGSKVKVVYCNPSSKIKWQGKVGKVVRVIGNEKAKVYEVEFKGQKIQKVRLNKKTGKLERGYENKKLVTTFDQEDIELYS